MGAAAQKHSVAVHSHVPASLTAHLSCDADVASVDICVQVSGHLHVL
jgi:hypothetical protein